MFGCPTDKGRFARSQKTADENQSNFGHGNEPLIRFPL
jgi:hypothetical protein